MDVYGSWGRLDALLYQGAFGTQHSSIRAREVDWHSALSGCSLIDALFSLQNVTLMGTIFLSPLFVLGDILSRCDAVTIRQLILA